MTPSTVGADDAGAEAEVPLWPQMLGPALQVLPGPEYDVS